MYKSLQQFIDITNFDITIYCFLFNHESRSGSKPTSNCLNCIGYIHYLDITIFLYTDSIFITNLKCNIDDIMDYVFVYFDQTPVEAYCLVCFNWTKDDGNDDDRMKFFVGSSRSLASITRSFHIKRTETDTVCSRRKNAAFRSGAALRMRPPPTQPTVPKFEWLSVLGRQAEAKPGQLWFLVPNDQVWLVIS